MFLKLFAYGYIVCGLGTSINEYIKYKSNNLKIESILDSLKYGKDCQQYRYLNKDYCDKLNADLIFARNNLYRHEHFIFGGIIWPYTRYKNFTKDNK